MIAWKKKRQKIFVLLLLFFLFLPIINILIEGFSAWSENFFLGDVFFYYLVETLLLGFGVCTLCLLIALMSAIFVSFFSFPARKILEWALILPFIIPTYILAYTYTDFLEFSGFLQTALRSFFNWQNKSDYWFFEIRSLQGAIFILSFSLYPYLYLLLRKALATQPENILQAGQLLGKNFFHNIFYLLIPLIKKNLFLGLLIIFVHTIQDFGVVEYFAVYTFSLGIYDLWFQRGNFAAASLLASLVACFIFALVLLDSYLNKNVKRTTNYNFYQRKRIRPSSFVAWSMFAFCFLIIFLGFLLPTGILIYYAILNYQTLQELEFWIALKNSLQVSFLAIIFILLFSFLFVYFLQRIQQKFWNTITNSTILNYALPSTILAVGIVFLAQYANSMINFFSDKFFSQNLGLVFGGLFLLVLAYFFKFFSLSQSVLGESMFLITPSLDSSGRNLGYYSIKIIKNIYFPIARKGFFLTMIILFVDIMRELPLTLILRPVSWNSLSTYIYRFSSLEMLEKTAIPALVLVFIGLVPAAIFSYQINKQK